MIDAAEWVGPHEDMQLGLHKTARYYYYPGWHEPGAVNVFGFNKEAYEALPVDLQRTLDHAAAAVQVYAITDSHAKNGASQATLISTPAMPSTMSEHRKWTIRAATGLALLWVLSTLAGCAMISQPGSLPSPEQQCANAGGMWSSSGGLCRYRGGA